ncbi:protein TORNADO 2 [Momordica charantia]|uniref:Protein TORNADO 2 n=1 Tax=Momordica charantia TaxID=3673 RepID=A0A6J1E4F1_MOMCH|nr:protein TORNADO 2 [Momordica charantia]
MALNKNIIGGINLVAMLLSVPIIGAGIWLATQPDNACLQILQWPLIIFGVAVLLVGVAGFIGAFCRITWLLLLYLVAMLVLILLLGSLVGFVYMVTLRGSGHLQPNRAYLEYHLDDFSAFLRRRVQSSFKWDLIRTCLSSSTMCAELNQSFRMAQDFFNAPITPMQSGCCKPPTLCGYTFVNPTYWIMPINNAADMDCLKWNNDQTQLCYSCDSCKAGLLQSLKNQWRTADIVLLLALVALISVYIIACCAFRNAKTETLFDKYKQGQPTYV